MRNYWIKVFACLVATIVALTPLNGVIFGEETPDIIVGNNASIASVVAGSEVNLPIPIENRTYTAITSVVVSLDDPSKYPFEIKSLSNVAANIYLGPKENKTIYLPLNVIKTAETKTYAMGLNFEYNTQEGAKGTISKTIYVKVTSNLDLPKLEILKTEVENGFIEAGQKGTVYFEMLNSGGVPLKDIRIAFKDLGVGLYPDEGDQTASIRQLGEKKIQRIAFDLKADDKAETKSYIQTLELTFKDEYDKSYTIDKKVYIPVRKGSDQVLDLALENVKVPTIARAGSDFIVEFALANHSQSVIQNITAKLEADAGFLAKSAPIQQGKKIEPGKSHPFIFKLSTKSDLEGKNYPIKAVFTYEVGTGTEQKTYYEYLNIEVGNASGKTTPKLIVSNYSYGSSSVMANQAFPLNLTFTNTNPGKPIHNIKVTLVSGENIFTPVDASNSFFITTIGAGAGVTKSVNLIADYSAKPKNYPIEIKMDYEDDEGKAFSQSDTISVPVMQEIVPRLSKIEIPTMTNLDTPTQMSLTVFNIGKAEIRNIFVTITGENITNDQGEVYLGNLGEGSDTYFDGSFTPTAIGEQKGTIHITYQDGAGKEFEITHDFTTTVEEMPIMEFGMDGMPPIETPSDKWIKWIKIGAGILLAIIIIVGVVKFLKRRKSRKQAEKYDAA